MKTIWRRSRQILISLPLLAVLILWVRSYSVRDTVKRYEMWEVPTGKTSITSHLRLSVLESQRGAWTFAISNEIDPMQGSPADVWKHELRWTEFWHERASDPRNVSIWTVPDKNWWNRLGFVWIQGGGSYPDSTRSMNSRFIGSPYWFPAVLFSLPHTLWILAAIRRKRLKGKGHCRKCGYDLRATPERCPECGTAAAGTVPHSGQRSGVARKS